jgi:hypothetical protein
MFLEASKLYFSSVRSLLHFYALAVIFLGKIELLKKLRNFVSFGQNKLLHDEV